MTISRAREMPVRLADGSECWVTVHPSYLLRLQDKAQAEDEYGRFVEDLQRVKARAEELAG